MFVKMCQSGGSKQAKQADGKLIQRYIMDYLVASSIDIDGSLPTYEFSVDMQSGVLDGQDKHLDRQAVFDMKKPMKLVGIDSIFVPQNWSVSDSFDHTCLVPHEGNECTLEMDYLYNNIINAMAQKLITALSLYRMNIKKKDDLPYARILTGARKNRNKSANR